LFVPGNNYRAILKTQNLNFDAAIFDLEDAVPVDDKETARIFVRDAITKLEFSDGRLKFIRVNGWDTGFTYDDLNETVFEGLDGVMFPKSESAGDITKLEKLLSEFEELRGISGGRLKIIPLIESAKGVLNSYSIASASERVVALAFGALDYYRTLGRSYFKFTQEQNELLFARSQIVNASKAAGVKAIDTPFFGLLVDKEGLLKESKMVWQLGFDGKLAVHPNHLEIINRVFTPSEEDVREAMEIVQEYEKARARGLGAITFAGRMIDYATYVQAKELLGVYEIVASRKTG